MKNTIRLSIILIGFTAMASQIIYMRELMTVFYGNELSISFIFASWLIAGAVGSALLGRFADKIKSKVSLFAVCQVVLGILLPSCVVAARLIKTALHVNPGEIIPLFPIIAASFIVLVPLCILFGFMFSLGCRIQTGIQIRPGLAIGNVYTLEAIGSIIGGALTSFILIRSFDSVLITSILSFLNILAALLLILFSDEKKFKFFVATSAAIFIAAIIVLQLSGGIKAIDQYSLKAEWQGYELLASKNSIYGNIAIVRKGEDYSFFDNGLRLYTIPEKQNAEEAAHLALLEHPAPKDVLLIGGGVGGVVEEILKEPVKRIDYVELDPLIIEMAGRYLPGSYYKALKDPRVSIKNTDGRFFIKNAKEKYDCIIIHIGDPYTAKENRYYTVEFFKEAKAILKKGGIISFSLSSSESYVNPALGRFLQSIYDTLKTVFADCIVIPGDTAYFLASDEKGALTYDYKVLEERTIERKLDTKYVRAYYLSSRLSPEKISYIENIVKGRKRVGVNYDFHPASYYYGLIFWTTFFRDSLFSSLLKSVNERMIWQFIAAVITVVAAFLLLYKRSFRAVALAAVMVVGFSSMAFQIIILLAFQILYGFLFYKLGFILTAFMAGLAIGSFLALKVVPEWGRGRIFLLAVQGDLIILSLTMPFLFSHIRIEALFPILSMIAGFIGGFQFPVANSILLGAREDTGRIGGLSYGVDLLGSCLGAILTGVILIPILGIPKTCLAIAIINLAVLALLAINVSIEE